MAYLRRLLVLPVLALALFTSGCDDDDSEEYSDLDANALDERFACDDLTVVAAESTGSRALLIGIDDGLAASVLATGVPVETSYALPDERILVRFVEGNNVYQGHCGRDNGSEWELDERTDAVAGTVFVRLTPDGEGGLMLDAELGDLLLAEGEALDESEVEMGLSWVVLDSIAVES